MLNNTHSTVSGIDITFLTKARTQGLGGEYHKSNNMSFKTTADLKEAVDDWCSARRDEAELKFGHISKWNVSNITSTKKLFKGKKYFDDDISDWDVHNVTDMSNMFSGAKKFNQPLYKWKISA
jgi:uncharacterized protein YdbL (DUF1318 family)